MARSKHSAIPDEQPGPDEGFKMGATPAPDDDVEAHRFHGAAPAPATDDAPQPDESKRLPGGAHDDEPGPVGGRSRS